MKIYGCYSGTDDESYFCELTVADPAVGAQLPFYRLNFGKSRQPNGSWQDLHPSTGYGSMTVILRGQIEFGVTRGAVKSIIGKQGDIFVFVDTHGVGHSTHNQPTGLSQIANMRFADPIDGLWPVLQKAFKGWPDNVKPPGTYIGGGPESGRHAPGTLDPNFDMNRFKTGK